ncbi:MAG: hypothetical protein FWG32_02970 [Oscillospiraceae bacterium]|nr:hypothetical protein [Oscillospiraceae bacterium]
MLDQLNVPTEKAAQTRGQRIWNFLRDARDESGLSLSRAKLVTAAYRETEGQPKIFRRARAYENIVDNLPIYIDDEQLLCGDFAAKPMGFEWWPELYCRWVGEALDNNWLTYRVSEDMHGDIRDIVNYWKDREAKQSFLDWLEPEFYKELCTMNEKGSLVFFAETEASLEKGWHVPNYEKVIKIGITGIIKEIDDELEALRLLDNPSYEKHNLLRAMKTALKASIRFAKRYSVLAAEMAKKETDSKRRKELEKISEVMNWIMENPARDFYDAIQTMMFCHICVFYDARCSGISFGRVDQYLYPYYKKDLDEGKITRELAVELLECVRCKCSSMRQFDSKTATYDPLADTQINDCRSGETQYHNTTLGGQTIDGKDAVNEMSFLWVEAAMNVRTAHPTLTIRWHPGINHEFKMAAAKLNKLGLGYPAWYNDLSSIPYFEERGVTHEDAVNYTIGGCVLHGIPAKTPSAWPGIFNFAKVLEVTLNNGRDPRLNKQIGPKTGELTDMSYDDLVDALMKQTEYFFEIQREFSNRVRIFRSHEMPNLFLSSLFDDCIKRGDGVFGGGCRYQISAHYLQPIGLPDVGDSLAAIKKCVFDDKSVGKDELIKALASDFEGYENVRKKLLAAPKFGNDDDYADEIVVDLYKRLFNYVHKLDSPYGSKYEVAPHSLSFHGASGAKVGALPSGRKSWLSLNDAGCSACQGMDLNGPTALINSAGKIDHTPIHGCLFNVKFHPSAMQTDEDLERFLDLIDTYFGEYLGKHIQFNVVDRDMLIAAQKDPQKHRNLVVRVAGYSALWVELNPQVQEEIISRTEHAF